MSDWRRQAACRGEDPELFFPTGTRGPVVQQQVALAKRVCGDCPVIGECRSWALRSGQGHGIAGGLTEDERARLRGTLIRSTQ